MKAVLDDLRDRFSIRNALRVHELKSQIAFLRQPGVNVMTYFTKSKGIWDVLSSYSKAPACTCSASKEFLRKKKKEKLHQFLMGFDDTMFRLVRS